jgi:hypothetical protein
MQCVIWGNTEVRIFVGVVTDPRESKCGVIAFELLREDATATEGIIGSFAPSGLPRPEPICFRQQPMCFV